MYKLDLTEAVGKFLQKLPAKRFRQIVTTIFRLKEQPELHNSKHLIGYSEYRRVDIGEYRIIYRVDDGTVKICVIGKRNDSEVYKQFKRSLWAIQKIGLCSEINYVLSLQITMTAVIVRNLNFKRPPKKIIQLRLDSKDVRIIDREFKRLGIDGAQLMRLWVKEKIVSLENQTGL